VGEEGGRRDAEEAEGREHEVEDREVGGGEMRKRQRAESMRWRTGRWSGEEEESRRDVEEAEAWEGEAEGRR